MHEVFACLISLAELSDMRCKHAAVILDARGTIIASGYNHKIQGGVSRHAEVSCLQNLRSTSRLQNSTLIVVRTRRDIACKGFHLSRPCRNCELKIAKFRKYGLASVLFSISCAFTDKVRLETLGGSSLAPITRRLGPGLDVKVCGTRGTRASP